MATLDEPTAGDVRLDNLSVVEDPERARHLIGFVPDELRAYWDTTVNDYIDFFARATVSAGMPGNKPYSALRNSPTPLAFETSNCDPFQGNETTRQSCTRTGK